MPSSELYMKSATMRNASKEALFFTSAPALNELCTVCIKVPCPPMKGGSVNTFQPQVIKCRELIFTEPEILASPVLGSSGKVQIIMQIDLFKSGRLQTRFQRMKVEMDKPKRVTCSDYQSCLKYTLLARLAPLWNKVGNYLVQGREFVVSTQKMTAITMELTSNDSQLYLQLKSYSVRIPPVCLQDLIISPQVLEEFLTNPDSKIQDYSIDNRWCHILPSMKKGQIVHIVHQIPSDSPFNSYKDVKKYWKNMYGYRLPETEEGLLYYQIYFKPIGHTLFTYPECCVRLKDITSFGCANQVEVLQQFLSDIHTKMPTLCGQKIMFESQALHTVPKLVGAGEDMSHNEDPNLSQVVSSQWSRSYSEKCVNQYAPWVPSGLHTPVQRNMTATSTLNTSIVNRMIGNEGSGVILGDSNNDTQYSNIVSENSKDGTITQSITNVVPENRTYNEITGTEVKCRNIGYTNYNSQVKDNVKQSGFSSSSECAKPRLVPVFKPKITGKGNFASHNPGSRNSDTKKVIPMFKSTQVSKLSQQSSGNDMFADLKKLKEKLGGSFNTGHSSNTSILPSQLKSVHLTPDRIPHFIGKNVLKNKSFTENNSRLLDSPNIIGTEVLRNTPIKRKLVEEGHSGETKIKKTRSKPKIQEHLDIVSLAKVNQLGKVNSNTLVSWLKSKDVPCRSKDKKAELIDKVYQYLQLKVSEQ